MKKIIFTLFAAGFTNLVSAAVPPLTDSHRRERL